MDYLVKKILLYEPVAPEISAYKQTNKQTTLQVYNVSTD